MKKKNNSSKKVKKHDNKILKPYEIKKQKTKIT